MNTPAPFMMVTITKAEHRRRRAERLERWGQQGYQVSIYQLPLPTQTNKRIVAAAATAVRARDATRAERARQRLGDLLDELDTGALGYWAKVVMIDGRYNGATGQGGYWAKASELVNQTAAALLTDRALQDRYRYGPALFVEV